MKKKNLKGLNFEKKIISTLQSKTIKGGNHWPTFETGCNSEGCDEATGKHSCLNHSNCICL